MQFILGKVGLKINICVLNYTPIGKIEDRLVDRHSDILNAFTLKLSQAFHEAYPTAIIMGALSLGTEIPWSLFGHL
jgi:hypothetical protein